MPHSVDRSSSPNLFQRLRTWLSGGAFVVVEPDPQNTDADTIRRNVDRMIDIALITAPNAAPGVLLPERLSLLGLDPYYLRTSDAATYRKLQVVCSQCPKWRRCAHDLGQGDATTGLQRYCYNSAAIDELMNGSSHGTKVELG